MVQRIETVKRKGSSIRITMHDFNWLEKEDSGQFLCCTEVARCYSYELRQEFLKDSVYACPGLTEVKKPLVTLSYAGLESLAVLLRMEFLRFVNPPVSLYPIGGGVEFLCNLVDIL